MNDVLFCVSTYEYVEYVDRISIDEWYIFNRINPSQIRLVYVCSAKRVPFK